MNTGSASTLPKPFVFVLMPFDSTFNDIYKFGIKGAADDVGAYAERLDEQKFTEGMLDRIFNQISKADVIVADMTGRNPNVFYEVGYAHALGKIVILVTKKKDDIPFDLIHFQHTIYGESIEILRKDLASKLQWAIAQSRQQPRPGSAERFSVRLLDEDIPRAGIDIVPPVIEGVVSEPDFRLPMRLRNESLETSQAITHVYLFCDNDSQVVPCEYATFSTSNAFPSSIMRSSPQPLESFQANSIDAPDGLVHQFRLQITFPSLPPGAVEAASISMMFLKESNQYTGPYRLRLHSPSQVHDYSFRLQLKFEPPETKQK